METDKNHRLMDEFNKLHRAMATKDLDLHDSREQSQGRMNELSDLRLEYDQKCRENHSLKKR